MRTDTGALSGWLLSKLAGLFFGGHVAGSPGVARNRAAGCVVFFFNSTHFFSGDFSTLLGGRRE